MMVSEMIWLISQILKRKYKLNFIHQIILHNLLYFSNVYDMELFLNLNSELC